MAVRSSDESIFWLLRCTEDVPESEVRWSGVYFTFLRTSATGDDEYVIANNHHETIWRDVVVADVTAAVQTNDKKLTLPKAIKLQIIEFLSTVALQEPPFESTGMASVSNPPVTIDDIAKIMNETKQARRLVSPHLCYLLSLTCDKNVYRLKGRNTCTKLNELVYLSVIPK